MVVSAVSYNAAMDDNNLNTSTVDTEEDMEDKKNTELFLLKINEVEVGVELILELHL